MIESIKHLYRFRRNLSFKGLFNAVRFFVPIKNISTVDILFACHDNSRTVFYDGKYYSPLIDSLIIKLQDYTSLTLALPFSRYSGKKTGGNTINLNLYILEALLKRFLSSGSIELKNISNDPLIKFYSRLYKKLNLKIIIAIQPSIEMCIAAKMNKIKVMDVQHGIIETDKPRSYYSFQRREKYDNIGWPDFILCRNYYSYNKVSALKNYTKPFFVGNLSLDFYQNNYNVKKKSDFYKNKKETILYTFQPTYPSTFSEKNICEGIIFPKELHKIILKSKYNFILKLHPSQIRNKNLYRLHMEAFKKLFQDNKNVDFQTCNQKPLEYSLANSSLHITYNSASLFDAFDFGLKTILLDNNIQRIKQYFDEFLDNGYAIIDPKLEIGFEKYLNCIEENNKSKVLDNSIIYEFISQNIK